ncbi:hypothetical protein B0H19DRAFT_1375944 [Mycena capillaripes]|nr:hypothetical protein B0H19DRAFT_1375944 [Mycena capillaripes]
MHKARGSFPSPSTFSSHLRSPTHDRRALDSLPSSFLHRLYDQVFAAHSVPQAPSQAQLAQSQSQSQALVAQPPLGTQLDTARAGTVGGDPTAAEWQHHAHGAGDPGEPHRAEWEQPTSTDPDSLLMCPTLNVNANGGSYGSGPATSANSSSNNIVSNANGSGNNGAETFRNVFHSSSPRNSNSSTVETCTTANASAGGAPQLRFTDKSLKVPPPAPTGGLSSFSPFSSDPKQQSHRQPHQQQQGMGGLHAAAELLGKRCHSYAGAYGHPSAGLGSPPAFPVQSLSELCADAADLTTEFEVCA